jgi:N-acetylglucosamine-6-phosphate deacetylase
MQINGCRYDTGEAISLEINQGTIVRCEPIAGDQDLPWIAPGFLDLQVNGYGGQEFNDLQLSVEKVEGVCRALETTGVTRFCPTATTHSFEMLASTMRILAQACGESESVRKRVMGFHLEGPYISPIDGPRGAHPLEHCRPPSWEEFKRLQDAAEGKIRILTLSPEYDGSAEFISKVAATNVVVAIGHTAADSEQIKAAVDAGASMSTHLGNGAHGQLPRHPNYIWEQLADDRLTASLIVDGHHLPAPVVKCFVRCKTSRRCILVSDLVGLAGMPPGRYMNTSIGDVEILDSGRLVVAGQRQYLAGAGLAIHYGIPNLIRFAGVSLSTAVEMTTSQPAELLGVPAGRIQVGAPAELVVFRLPTEAGEPLTILQTV